MDIAQRFFSLFRVYNDYNENKQAENNQTNTHIKQLSEFNTFYAAASRAYRRGVVGTGFRF